VCYYRSGETALIQWLQSGSQGLEASRPGQGDITGKVAGDIANGSPQRFGLPTFNDAVENRKIWKGQARRSTPWCPVLANDFGDSCRESTGTRLTLISY